MRGTPLLIFAGIMAGAGYATAKTGLDQRVLAIVRARQDELVRRNARITLEVQRDLMAEPIAIFSMSSAQTAEVSDGKA